MPKGVVFRRYLAIFLLIVPAVAFAEDNAVRNTPWERASFTAGVFFASLNSSVRIGTEGGGIEVNVEDALGMQTSNRVFRLGAMYRIGEERRHRIDVSYLGFRRRATKTLEQDVVIDGTTFPVGTNVESMYNFTIVQGSYSYSFIQDDRLSLGASFGLFVMPITFEISSTGVGSVEENLNVTAPLPVVGLRFDVALAPKVVLKQSVQLFFLSYDSFRGSLANMSVAVEYNPWEHFGLGLGLETLRTQLEAEGNDYPSIDFLGNVQVGYTGAQLYGKVYF